MSEHDSTGDVIVNVVTTLKAPRILAKATSHGHIQLHIGSLLIQLDREAAMNTADELLTAVVEVKAMEVLKDKVQQVRDLKLVQK